MTNTEYTIYFAGELFDHKDLVGNALLASYIGRVSDGRYRCVLPQDMEQTSARAVQVRNQDLATLLKCDLAIFNFDGVELDSGTVVEFMYAKMLDIPCLVLRSDFRRSGDQGAGERKRDRESDDWNLMASFYPRTRKLQFDAMEWYQEERARGDGLEALTERLYRRIASAVVTELDAVRAEQPLLQGSRADAERIYRWALRFPGSGLDQLVPDPGEIVVGKAAKGLLGLDI